MNILRRVGRFFLDIIEAAVMAMAIFVLVYLFLFQPHQVRGNSMYPNFHDREYLLTDKISYRFHEPARGDVIVFRAPQKEEYEYIKRIVGMPGDSVKISNGKIYINGNLVEEIYLPTDYLTNAGRFLHENQTIEVDDNLYFVLGDNRSHSSDSREWGLVPRDNIIGKAWFRYWPIGNAGLIAEAKYQL
jgi:signal peptidase I